MATPPALRAATTDELAEALSSALRYDGRKRVHHALGLRGDAEAAGGRANGVEDAKVGCMTMDIATDQLIDAAAAQSLSADVGRDHALAAWIIVRDQPSPARSPRG